jgi:hypothetical protein
MRSGLDDRSGSSLHASASAADASSQSLRSIARRAATNRTIPCARGTSAGSSLQAATARAALRSSESR